MSVNRFNLSTKRDFRSLPLEGKVDFSLEKDG